MKARYILFAIAALAIAACAKTIEQPETTGKQIIIKAYQEGASGTKTTVQDGGTQVFWEPGDEISVFFRGYGSKFTARNTELAAVTEFSGTLLTLVGAQEGNVASNLIWGLYPYRSDATSDGVSVTTTLSTAQTGRAGSFDKHTHICLAASTGLDLAFYNVTGGLRFTLSRDDITSISFKGNKGEALAGKFKLAFADGVPYVTEMLDASDLITLYAPEGETFKPGVWYYIVTLPATLSEGFKMSFNSASCTGLRQTWKEVNIKRGVFGNVENIDEGVEFYALPEAVDLGLPSGTLWASFNVGASKPSEIGGRFAWGET